jgi:hypothetical protein
MSLQAELMAILDATVAHLIGHREPATVVLYKIIALRWYDQRAAPSAPGLSWRMLPDGRRHCVIAGIPQYAAEDGTPLTLEELRV